MRAGTHPRPCVYADTRVHALAFTHLCIPNDTPPCKQCAVYCNHVTRTAGQRVAAKDGLTPGSLSAARPLESNGYSRAESNPIKAAHEPAPPTRCYHAKPGLPVSCFSSLESARCATSSYPANTASACPTMHARSKPGGDEAGDCQQEWILSEHRESRHSLPLK